MLTQIPSSRRKFHPVLSVGGTYINICMYAPLSARSGLGLRKPHRQCQQAKHPGPVATVYIGAAERVQSPLHLGSSFLWQLHSLY